MWMHNAGWGWWVLMSVGMVAFWALVVYGIVWLARGTPNRSPAEPPEPPMTVLDRRLAAGELTVQEYEQRRDALLEDGDRPGATSGVGA
jgi:putative membrane protein